MKYLKRSPTSSSTGIAVLSNDLILPKSYENAMEGCVSPLLVRASNRFRSRLAGIWCKLEFQWNAYTDKKSQRNTIDAKSANKQLDPSFTSNRASPSEIIFAN